MRGVDGNHPVKYGNNQSVLQVIDWLKQATSMHVVLLQVADQNCY